MATTANYGWNKPAATDTSAVRTDLNAIHDAIDTSLKAVADAKAALTDPLGFGIVSTVFPFAGTATVNPLGGSSNRTLYYRALGAATISNLAIFVGGASGNICVATYTGSAGVNPPATRTQTSGSVACPAAGEAVIALGGSVAVAQGTGWLSFSADNGTVSVWCLSTNGGQQASTLCAGLEYIELTFPCPSPASPLHPRFQHIVAMRGS